MTKNCVFYITLSNIKSYIKHTQVESFASNVDSPFIEDGYVSFTTIIVLLKHTEAALRIASGTS